MTVGAEPWDTEWAAERAAEALRYLGRNYPECLENPRRRRKKPDEGEKSGWRPRARTRPRGEMAL